MSFLIPLSEDENYEILSRDPNLRQLREFVQYVHKAEQKEEVPKKGTVKGDEKPFSKIPEGRDERFYTINYIAKLMGVSPSEVSRRRKSLVNSGDFLKTNIFEMIHSKPKYFRISDEKVAECIEEAVEGYFFELNQKERDTIHEIVERTNTSQFTLFHETSASKKKKYVKGEERKIQYSLVECFYLAVELMELDFEGYEELYSKFSQYDNRNIE
jgi:DNA-binding Lrp family transcriptional regulator